MAASNRISYKKLRDGSWGIVGPESRVRSGANVNVTKSSGETKMETVDRVLWRGDGVAIATVKRTFSSQGRTVRGDGGPRGDYPCYMCGSYYCDGARGGLCEDD